LDRSFHISKQLTCLLQERPSAPTFCVSFAGKEPVLKGVLISKWRAWTGRTTMHTTTLLSKNCGRSTGSTRAGSRTETCTGKRRYDVALVSACHERRLADWSSAWRFSPLQIAIRWPYFTAYFVWGCFSVFCLLRAAAATTRGADGHAEFWQNEPNG